MVKLSGIWQAADELCTLSQTGRGGDQWLMQAASRLIVGHESEWANPSKWKRLIATLEKQPGEVSRAQHEEEQKRAISSCGGTR